MALHDTAAQDHTPPTHRDRSRGESSPANGIRVRDAHLRNLRHVDVDLPRDCLVAFTGVSGSGKSSLAFGTLHGEAQRRYMESIAPFARRLIGSAVDPQVGSVDGLPPTVALQQSTTAGGARSTVGTVSTMSNTVRLLFSRSGDYPDGVRKRNGGRLDSDSFSPNTAEGMCPTCQGTGTVHEPTEQTMVPNPSLSIDEGAIAAWPGAWLGKNFHDIVQTLGYPMHTPWKDIPQKDRDWILFTEEQPVVTVHPQRGADQIQRTYEGTWRSVAVYLRQTLSETGSDSTRRRVLSFMEASRCPTCDGRRLNSDALQVTWLGYAIDELGRLSLEDVLGLTEERMEQVSGHDGSSEAERMLLEQLVPTCRSVVELGLGHLSLDRAATTLSAGELQRLRLASLLRSGLFGVAYVLDEPTAGLHPVERQAVVELVRDFIRAGNSVLLVEHDMHLVAQADWAVDVGPGAGEDGGAVLWSGPVDQLREAGPECSATAQALARGPLSLKESPRAGSGKLELRKLSARTLKNVDVDIPLGALTCVAGVSGSGKTTLLAAVNNHVVEQDKLKLVEITQKPIGRTRRSTLATYTGLFDHVRKLFAATPAAKERGWGVSRFSYNNAQGRCATCHGEGSIEVELVFLPGSSTTCPECHGARYNPETLEVTWEGLTIAQILDLTVAQAREVFEGTEVVDRALRALEAIGLGYLRLGQGSPELSGGEAQRIKLATELQRARRGRTVYLMDEPTTGLHPADIERLLSELNRLVDDGDTVVVVEHDMSVAAGADFVVEMGPGAGANGGEIIAHGTPSQVSTADTPTGRTLADRAAQV